jgi:hypothetical protein
MDLFDPVSPAALHALDACAFAFKPTENLSFHSTMADLMSASAAIPTPPPPSKPKAIKHSVCEREATELSTYIKKGVFKLHGSWQGYGTVYIEGKRRSRREIPKSK